MKHNVHIEDVPANCYAALVLLHRVYTKLESGDWNKSRKNFLDAEFKKHGDLVCHYCHRKGLKRNTGKHSERATVDHVQAKSSGGDPLAHNNFVVSCESCNRKKSNRSATKFLISKYLNTKRRTKA